MRLTTSFFMGSMDILLLTGPGLKSHTARVAGTWFMRFGSGVLLFPDTLAGAGPFRTLLATIRLPVSDEPSVGNAGDLTRLAATINVINPSAWAVYSDR